MKIIGAFVAIAILVSCNTSTTKTEIIQDSTSLPIIGTWKLLTGTLVDKVKGDTAVTNYTKDTSFIKIINGTHFAFLGHDLTKGKGAAPYFSAGGGHYTLVGDQYTEYLEYCSDRQWENNPFKLTASIQNDTLELRGIEKIDSIKVNRLNIERYVRIE